jgi:cytochrome c5
MSRRSSRRARLSSCLSVAVAVWLVSAGVSAQSAGAALRTTARPELPAGDGAGTARARCLTCHGADLISQQRLSRDGWTREVDKMIGWGAVVESADRIGLVDYLTRHFGPAGTGRLTAQASATGEALVRTRCLTCHDDRLIVQQRLDAAGWGRVVDKMIGWGAAVGAAERAALVEHLAPAPIPR